jgi:hypothetical protein
LYLPPFIFWELREESFGDLAATTYASHPSPLRSFFESQISPSPCMHHQQQCITNDSSTTTTITNITTAATTKRCAPFPAFSLPDTPVEAAIAPH